MRQYSLKIRIFAVGGILPLLKTNRNKKMNVAIIGGGAAGFFAAVNLKMQAPHARITIFEKQDSVLKKVLISGGGRCNLTNTFEGVTDLKQVYPRGHKLLKGLFREFNHESAFRWYEAHGVRLTVQDDHCVFPVSQDAHSVAGCLSGLAQDMGIAVKTSYRMESIMPRDGRYDIIFRTPDTTVEGFDKVIITTGGSPRHEGLLYLERLGHKTEHPVPSLFTFNINDASLHDLSGTVVDPVTVCIPGTRFRATDALLVTHWGMSGPAILKLSSHAARYMNEKAYRVPLIVNWTNEKNQEHVSEVLADTAMRSPQKQLSNTRPFDLPARLWAYLLEKTGIMAERKWGEFGKKSMDKLTNALCNDYYNVENKSACREEFVTCGGVSMESICRHSLESKVCPGLYFAGEVLDIDGVTGGFNFQAAWTTAYTVARAIAQASSPDSIG